MTTFFISRHAGAIDWIKQQGIEIDRWCSHLELKDVSQGDLVVGTLPIPMVAGLYKKGAIYIHLSVELPAHLRGKELSEDTLFALGASLQEFRVMEVNNTSG